MNKEHETYLKEKRFLTLMEVCSVACRASKKWGVYISFDSENFRNSEIEDATGGQVSDIYEDSQVMFYGQGLRLLDTEEEMMNVYHHIVGDGGPTKFNDYDGECRVFAMTISNEGQILTENT